MSTEPIRVTMVIGGSFPALGGAEIQALRLAKALGKYGHQIDIVCLNTGSLQKSDELWESIPVHRCGVFTVPGPGGERRMGSLSSFPSVLGWILRRKPRPQLIHLHLLTRATLAGALAGRLMGIPVIAKLGNSGRRFDFKQVRETYFEGRLIASLFKSSVSAFVAPSRAVRRDLLEEGINETDVVSIPNGVDLDLFSKESRDSMKSRNSIGKHQDFSFIYTGTLKKKKNLHILIDAFAKAQTESTKELNLIIVGDGPERRSLEAMAAEHNLTGKITFTGSQEDVRPWLARADAFVLPSEAEGLPNAMLEAMATSLPAIATAVGGSLDLIDPRPLTPDIPQEGFQETSHGYLVTPGDISGLVKALLKISENPEKARSMGRSGRDHVIQNYALVQVALRYETLYQSLL